MENQQMGMPAEASASGMAPDQMAVFDQMRQEISPQEFSNEMLAGASQVDPQAVAEFTRELQGLDMPPEALDALNDVVDEILANPERYEELRAGYLAEGLPEDILPEQFDAQFFAGLNMAIDQMIAAPAGPEAFAKGGIAELKPIAKAIASYGRNGDTMLAHITPAEARMLRRRGGSGTINPDTGLPEFFIDKLWKETGGKVLKSVGKQLKKVGNAVKKFAKSSVGRIVTAVALGFFLGPAAASFLSVGSAAGVAAVSGFIGGAGSTLLAGGNLRDALKAGAIGGVTAGVTAGVTSGFDAAYAGPTTVGGQVDAFKSAITPNAPLPTGEVAGQAPLPAPDGGAPAALGQGTAPVPQAPSPVSPLRADEFGTTTSAPVAPPGEAAGFDATASQGSLTKPPGAGTDPSMLDKAKDIYGKHFSPEGIQEQGAQQALSKVQARFPGTTVDQIINAPANSVLGKAYQAALPGTFATYAPITGVALAGIGALGGFQAKPVEGGDITKSLMKPASQRMREEGTQRENYIQNIPGVQYDQYGEPIFGKYSPLPTYGLPDFSGTGQASTANAPLYTPQGGPGMPQGSPVQQPYNTASMYPNLVPRGYSEGGSADSDALPPDFDWAQYLEANPDLKTAGIKTKALAEEHWRMYGKTEKRSISPAEAAKRAADEKAAQIALEAKQAADRNQAYIDSQLRRAGGSSRQYGNINAGISSGAPEVNPNDPSDTTYGERNRARERAALDAQYKPIYDRARPVTPYGPNAPGPIGGGGGGGTAPGPGTVPGPGGVGSGPAGTTNPSLTREEFLRLREVLRAEYTAGPKTQAQLDTLLLKYPPAVMQAEFPEFGNVANYNNAAREAYARTEQQARERNREAMRASGQEVSVANPGGSAQISSPSSPVMSPIPQSELDAARAKLPPEQAAFIDWQLAQVNPMTGQRVADDYARQGTNPYASGARAQEQIDRGANRGALLSQSGVSTAGLTPWTDPNWRATQQAKEDAERARMDKQTADWLQIPEAQRTVAGPGATQGSVGTYGNYLDKPMYTPPTASGGIMDWYNANVGRTDSRAQADLNNFLANSGYTAKEISAALPQWGEADLDNAINVARGSPAPVAAAPAPMAAAPAPAPAPAVAPAPTAMPPVASTPVPMPSLAPAFTPPVYSESIESYGAGYASGGIAALNAGGYPRRTGQISGPGTEKSDSIPAMLSDGEFVMTAKAVRGAGKGSRREGAKRMYKLMHQLEKNSQRG